MGTPDSAALVAAMSQEDPCPAEETREVTSRA
ncbi:hypothetical protein SAMN04489717_5041 [Actinopolymorpha singaporensis]|uniref:Uncharacterized protein n=1 Tax=Actinopolymorpha singaporensis TaxID=117157 RepID=A0A1H1XM89_9ACTN|nr:hypothetical protein SAMN04489717_5041 [Actinopolymorpha singaporensis]